MERIYPDELCHYGVLGMKWGVRRYQNEDGTRTALGKVRERMGRKKTSTSPEEKKAKRQKNVRKAGDAAAVAGAVAISRMAGKAALEGNPQEQVKAMKAGKSYENVVRTVDEKRNKKRRYAERENYRKQARGFSDKELQDRVRRLNLEKQYVDLSSGRDDDGSWSRAEKVAFGREVVQTILPFVAPVVIGAAKRAVKR